MSDQGEQTPERELADDCRLFADSVERQGTPWAQGCARVLRLAASALRSAEARGRVQGRQEMQDEMLLGGTGPSNSGEGAPVAAWFPIGTAPRDRTWFLAWSADLGYLVYRMGPGLIAAEEPDPTHWMPLPSAPVDEQEQTK